MEAVQPTTGHKTGDEPIIRDSAVTQTNPQEINHVAFTEGINDILYKKYTHLATLTLSPTMLAGTIFGLIPNHPFACSQSIRHIARLFGAWTGEMHIRARFASNFLAGGSIRVGQFPPTMTEKQIRSLSLEELTFHPNVDFDPKDMEWINQKAVDSRRTMYHTMSELDTTDPDSFGGWIVFYVVAPLVSNMNQEGTIQLVVEACGNYNFREPRVLPNSNPTPAEEGPLPPWTLKNIMDSVGCDDGISTRNDSSLVLATGNYMTAGFAFASGFNGTEPWKKSGNVHDYTRTIRNAYLSGDGLSVTTVHNGSLFSIDKHWCWHGGNSSAHILPPCLPPNGVQMNLSQVNRNPGVAMVVNSEIMTYRNAGGFGPTMEFRTGNNPGTWVPIPEDEAAVAYAFARAEHHWFGKPFENMNVYQPSNSTQRLDAPTNESVVVFYNSAYRTINMQTKAHSDALLKSKGLDDNKSYVYQLRKADNDAILMYMRLCPNGMWTTNLQRTQSIITYGDYYLKYFGVYDLAQPLPSPSTLTKKLFAKMSKYSRIRDFAERKPKMQEYMAFV